MGRNAQRRRAARAALRQPVQSRPVLFYDVELWHLDDGPGYLGVPRPAFRVIQVR